MVAVLCERAPITPILPLSPISLSLSLSLILSLSQPLEALVYTVIRLSVAPCLLAKNKSALATHVQVYARC